MDTASAAGRVGLPPWAELIRRRREELGLSLEAVAMRAGLSYSLIRKIERGAHDPLRMSHAHLLALLKALEIGYYDFLAAMEGAAVPKDPRLHLVRLAYYPSPRDFLAANTGEWREIDARLLPPSPDPKALALVHLDQKTPVAEGLLLRTGDLLVVDKDVGQQVGSPPGGVFLLRVGTGEHHDEVVVSPLEGFPLLLRSAEPLGKVFWLSKGGHPLGMVRGLIRFWP